MGKQFSIWFTQKDMDYICSYLLKKGYYLYRTKYVEKFNSKTGSSDVVGSYLESVETKSVDLFLSDDLCISNVKKNKLKPYNPEYGEYIRATSYPMIEFSFRMWIDSRAKGMKIWDDFDEIKKWLAKEFPYKDKTFWSKELLLEEEKKTKKSIAKNNTI